MENLVYQCTPAVIFECRLSADALRMFVVFEANAAAIRDVLERGGELAAAGELRRLFPGIVHNARAVECACAILRWRSFLIDRPALSKATKPLTQGLGKVV